MRRRAPVPIKSEHLSGQVGRRLSRVESGAANRRCPVADDKIVSTGSTLLDLAISGSRYSEGGVPGGILVEMFGPPGCGKTVVMCEMAGFVQRGGGEVMFRDPEGRLNAQFASLFGFEVERVDYGRPDTIVQLFEPIRSWDPKGNGGGINAIFADSLAALSTEMEMDEGDKYGMRRAKEFSQECRQTCRVLAQKGYLMVASNQVRQNVTTVPFAEKYTTSGGLAIPHYASLRLRFHSPVKTPREVVIDGKKHKRTVGVHTTVEVYKSSIDAPFRTAPVHILYDYGIDDIRANLEFIKSIDGPSGTFYEIGDKRLGAGLEASIRIVEDSGLERQVKDYTIQLWRELEEKFQVERRPKRRQYDD